MRRQAQLVDASVCGVESWVFKSHQDFASGTMELNWLFSWRFFMSAATCTACYRLCDQCFRSSQIGICLFGGCGCIRITYRCNISPDALLERESEGPYTKASTKVSICEVFRNQLS